ncbi:IS5 family transposase [Noviherbaspirillum pedocola]|uniref:IS5 family transposase n=1 Tax=Noviherbaspirillum pedocola TaxID=2801341 RepID=A0A934T033_9BURK|nr:IS5 family transposase [Noviherbaspirillum pedocola]MBK4739008.1 IS5 family transposase [Noviherbaspirillum pedocola]
MAKPLLPDELWNFIEPLLPARTPSPKGGRPRLSDRAALTGILFVLKTGIPWEYLPQELGCGSGMTCWRRLRDWQQAGVWQRLHLAMLHRMREYDQIHWERASVDSASVPSPHGGTLTGSNPTDRGKFGCKHHLIVDQRGLPLVVQISGANVHDSQMLCPLINALPLVAGLSGHPRRRPDKLHADKGYDYACYRRWLRQRGITPRIARRGQESKERLGRYRWVVERTIGWLHRYRRLHIRYERRAEIHLAFLYLACSLICWRFIQRFC